MKWEEMKGDDKRRYCEHCQLHVHNLSAMSLHEQRETLAPESGPRCISYISRPDAVPVDPARWQALQSPSWWRRMATAMLLAVSAVFMNSCRTTGKMAPTGGHSCPPDKPGLGGRTTGAMVPPPPRLTGR